MDMSISSRVAVQGHVSSQFDSHSNLSVKAPQATDFRNVELKHRAGFGVQFISRAALQCGAFASGGCSQTAFGGLRIPDRRLTIGESLLELRLPKFRPVARNSAATG